MNWSKAGVYGKATTRVYAHAWAQIGTNLYSYGGGYEDVCSSDLSVFNTETMFWSSPATHGDLPPPLKAHSLTAASNNTLYLYGGGNGSFYSQDLFALDTETLQWKKLSPTGETPSGRRAHTACYYDSKIYFFGGGDGKKPLNETYVLNIGQEDAISWTKLETTGTLPSPRAYHASIIVDKKMIVYGGSDGAKCFSDVHILDLESKVWTNVAIPKSFPRLSHTVTQVGGYLYCFGGHNGQEYVSELLLLNLVTMRWETRVCSGKPPPARGSHCAILHDSRILIFAGHNGQEVFDDLYFLDLASSAYLPQISFTISI